MYELLLKVECHYCVVCSNALDFNLHPHLMTMSNNYTAVSHASRDMMNPSSVLVLSPQTQGGGIFWVLGSQHEVGSSELFCAASYGEAMTY